MTTLADFLLARIAEDEAWAHRTLEAGVDPQPMVSALFADPHAVVTETQVRALAERYTLDMMAAHDPASMLAECEAKRRIVELHVPDRHLENWYWTQRKCAECGGLWHVITPFAKPTDIGAEQGCPTLRLVALPYADHPDYREEWKP